MNSDRVKAALNDLFGTATSKFPCDRIAADITMFEDKYGMELSAYGFAKFIFDLYGVKALYQNVGGSSTAVQKYAEAAKVLMDDMPVMLLNASAYVQKIFEVITDKELCFKQLEGMTFPYVMYVLFAGGEQPELVEQYRPEFEEQMKRYPSMLDKLPAAFKQLKETVNANS